MRSRGPSSTSSAVQGSTSRTPTGAGRTRSRTRSSGPRRCSRSTWTPRRPTRENWNLVVQRSLWRQYLRRSALRRGAGNAPAAQRRGEPGRLRARARRRRTPTGGASTPTALPTAARATSRRSRCCATSRSSTYHSGQVSAVAPLHRRSRLQRLLLVLEVARRAVGDEPLRRVRQAVGRRERPRAEPVRSRRGVRAVAVRRTPPPRGERELGAARCPTPGIGATRGRARWLADQRRRASTTPARRSRCRTRRTSRCRPTARLSRASRPAARTWSAIPTPGPRTANEWISRSSFQRLNPQTQAGQFGNAGRNIARGPAFTNVDVSLVRTFALPARRAPAGPRRGVQRRQPRELRPAGGRPQLGELRPHLLRRSAAADAIRR